ncbi:tetratricopeptide repeat protein [Occallatibacter riparius]|uniref:Tetratricopeptide repeat protein n=1 Tax=Occallatibacter riparius TaxID=1002689 RepID=A0A9J7BTD1_9BACT|nr:tetratricopeptide repeat protein [Occallatibacter riparius]UWZ85849.1 tetratricopeptide repeat protein [Occallatibacter riparius]
MKSLLMRSLGATVASIAVVIALSLFHTPAFSQVDGPSKEPRAVTAPYSAEEGRTVAPAFARKEAELRAQITQRPNDANPVYSLALLLLQEGKAHESLDAYTHAAQLRTPVAEEIRSVALDYVLLNDYDDAIRWLERAVRMDPANVRVLYSLGRCYFSRDRYLDAERMFAHVLALEPKNLKAQENLGLVFDATNQPDRAEEALRIAASWADKDGTDEWPFLDYGGFLLDHGRAQESVEPLRTAAHIQPNCAACHQKLGRALIGSHELKDGIAELEIAARLGPSDPKTHYELGRALRQAGQTERAQQEFALSQKLYASHSHE